MTVDYSKRKGLAKPDGRSKKLKKGGLGYADKKEHQRWYKAISDGKGHEQAANNS